MPDYEYQCTECGETFVLHESLDEHSERKTLSCPHCDGDQVERIFSPVYVRTSRKA